MISARSVCHCTGPVVNLLLDYVVHVKLCSRLKKLLESDDSWMHVKDKTSAYVQMNQQLGATLTIR